MPVNPLKPYEKIYVIKADLIGPGFGALVLQTLNQIRYCRRNNYLPVVHYDRICGGYFFDSAHGNNTWEQYFQPVGGYSFEDIEKLINDPHHPLTQDDVMTLPNEAMLRIVETHLDSIYSYTFADWRENMPADLESWYERQRDKGRDMVNRYITVKPHISEKADRVYQQLFTGHYVLGVQIRGTDLAYAPPVSPAEYFPIIDRIVERQQQSVRIYLATDQAQYVDAFEKRYPDRILSFDCARSDNEVAPFNLPEISPYKKGEDVLIDILLLSRTNFLLKGASNVGEMALYFNPQLKCLDLSVNKMKAFGEDYGAKWRGGNATKTAWELVGNTDLSRLDKNASTQNWIQANLYRIRPECYLSLIRRLRRIGDKIGKPFKKSTDESARRP